MFDQIAAANDRLRSLLDPPLAVGEPSGLPGWTRGHLLTHFANCARAIARQAEYALRGETIEIYDGGRPGRAAAIEAGAHRPAREQAEDVRAALDELEAVWCKATTADWARPVSYRDGTLLGTAQAWWREIELHTVDLGLGYTPAEWTPEFTAYLTDFLRVRLPGPVELSGDPTDVAAWLAGRPHAGPVTAEGGLPELLPYP
ncbi:maleylpyruvate isomerase [Crossiella equi]|uniref:Maleylpyruvate isomerase n=1 Tax=Crossiella equi TaxID=130796 RepID=A0ABS5AAM1_9PSEU|nr:maleylpyruvate isomerase family mycothiol-dependent enzyme [Crossiella equi]MBP2473633.1 maleylpyruvate isomerase [Crossiella equi]